MKQGLCKSYLLEREQGIHVWGTDVMMLALYGPNPTLDPDVVTTYLTANEVVGSGYVAGGVVLALTPGFPKLSPTIGVRKVLFDFVDVAVGSASGFSYRQGLIYNKTKQNRGVAVLDFGTALLVTASYGVVWPAPDDNNAIIRSGA